MKKSPSLLFYLVLLAILFTFKGNSQNVIYTPLYSSSNFTKTISLTAPVGTVAGMPDAAGGSASYTIPIATPPGTNGVVPSVSVTYSSLSGSGGIAGMGWNIGGLSAISRTGANFYFDGNVKPVDLSSNDRFLLDGSRLISKTGTYGAVGATYGTEIENFATITSYDVMGGDPGYFIVEAKDGTIMEYGKSTDSRFLNASNSEVLLWRLNKILYKDGNYILFKYTNVDRDSRIDEILYTGNDFAGLTPYNKIKFSYLVRTDIKTVYEAGIPVVSKFLLDKITITAEAGVAFKTYTFNYATNNNINSFLNAVFEAGSDGSTLNSTIFKYGDLPTAFQSNTSSALVNQYLDIFPGDFNGDGYSDMLTCTRDQVNIGRHTDFKVYIKSPSSSNTSFTAPTASGTVSLASYEVIGKYYNFFSGDYTGDGADDVMIANVTGSGNNRVLEHVRIHESKLNGTDFQTYVQRIPQAGWKKIHSSGKYIVQGDFDGDGLMDFITMLGNNTTSVFDAFLCTGSVGVGACGSITINGASSIPVVDWVTCNRIDAVDFNGDGKTDLMLVKPGLTEIYTFEGLTAKRIYTRSFPDSYHLLFFGDFNGDNKTDLLVRNSLNDNNALWYKHISTGTDYIESPFTFVQKPDITGTYFRNKILIADYNGDGKMDIAHGWNETSGTTAKVDIYYSRGDNFYSERYSYSSAFVGSPTVFTFDSNGDGRMEFMSRNYYADPFNILSFNKEGKDLLLHKVKNGIDHTCEWNYKRMTEAGTFYTRGSLTAYPLNNIQAPINLVSSLATSNGIGSNATTLYNYEEVKFHRRGKGWLGFKLTTATNSTLGTRTVSENEINTTFYMAAPYKISTYLTSDNSLLSEVTYTNQFTEQSLGSKRVWVKTTGVNENRAFQKQTTTTANTYDTFGNITQSVVNNNNEETTTTSATFGTFGTPIPAKPTLITVSNTRLGSTAYNVSTSFTYNNTGQLTGKTEFSNQTQNVVYAYTYNLLGNQTGVTATPSGMTARGGSSIFDSKGRYALSITNALSQTATATYDAKWGKLLTQTGIDGLTTSFQYDAFGRLTTTTFPTGVTMTETYGWDINATDGTINYHLSSSAGKPDVKVWFDLLSREKKRQTEGFQSLWMTKLTTYDARGNMATETAPYKSGETVLTTTHTYDTYNRITSSTNTIGTTSVAYSYANDGKLTTTITDPAGRTNSRVTESTGKTVSVTDNGGTLTYTYNSQGNTTQVKQGSTVLITNEYDVYGRQTKLTDINAGITQYAYNMLSQMTSQTTALNGITNMSYDVLGRVTQKVGPEGTTTYEFFPSGSNAATNQIKKITGFSGDVQEFTYDSYGRVSTDKVTVDATAHTSTYTYNNYNDVLSVAYPSGFTLNYAYDANGYLNTLKNGTNTVTLFTNGGMNGLNQYTSYTLGNSKTSTNSYYFGTPTRYLATGLQDLNLTWNYQNGNLTTRNDAIKGKTETFTYDNLDRLLTSTVTGLTAMAMTYAANGNISSKSDVGNYTYGISKINAVTGISNPSATIPLLTQSVTYTPYFQPATITENTHVQTYTYGYDQQRIKGELKQSGTTLHTRYYFGSYEKEIVGSTTRHLHYINAGQGIVAIVVRENGTDTYNYVYTDHLGSILTVTNNVGTVVAEQNFDAWGRKRNTATWTYSSVQSVPSWLYRGYTGHEHLPQFNLINMNGRLYDPLAGRMLSVDNYVQGSGLTTQGYNRYSYALNNPLRYTDPNGEIIIAPILIGIAYGAIIGASVSAAVYASTVAVTNQSWSWGAFGRAVAIGAVGGAISGGIGGVGVQLGAAGQSIAFNVLSNVASSSATQLAFGQKVTLGSVAGSVLGGLVGAGIGDFNGVKGGSVKNAVAEIAFGVGKGAIIGGVGGVSGAIFDGGNANQGFVNGAKYGAISGGTMSALRISTMGAAYKPTRSYGTFGRFDPVYRRGTFITRALAGSGSGITIGRNLVTHQLSENTDDGESIKYNHFLRAHEEGHYQQQIDMGFGAFYARTLYQYFFNPGFNTVYDTPGTLEYGADQYAKNILGYGY